MSPNRLIEESSPYLLQHAHNPVDWYPWGDDAFTRAREEDRPVFLSIGYSACHWCHVMERESFEDEEVASLMNRTFVNVKVDREERPDIDAIYMDVCQLMTGHGGWPLTIIMTPDRKPFFAGTYIPKESGYGRVGMKDLMTHVMNLWNSRRREIESMAERAVLALREYHAKTMGAGDVSETLLHEAFSRLWEEYDDEYGGFGTAPKFPLLHRLMFLLRYWQRTGDPRSLDMAERTLSRIRLGGIRDHVGHGFHRYSTDRVWLVPHFEKMLHDQALAVMTYTEAFQVTGREDFRTTAVETMDYVLDRLTSPEGAFYSSEDADSAGKEGDFYLWEMDEIVQILPGNEARNVIDAFNVTAEGNFKDEATGSRTGKNILYLKEDIPSLAQHMGVSEGELRDGLEESLDLLRSAREKRERPPRDDKIMTDWNGLMIAGASKAAAAFGREDMLHAAEKAADFILERMVKDDLLMHCYREGSRKDIGFLNDYAYLIWGLLELYQAGFDAGYLKEALRLAGSMVANFWDEERGGLFLHPRGGEELISRKKETYDGSLPSGNSVALLDLILLHRLTADIQWGRLSRDLAGYLSPFAAELPHAHTFFLIGVDMLLGPSSELVVVGKRSSTETKSMLETVRGQYLPRTVIVLLEPGDTRLVNMIPFTSGMSAVDGKTTAYLCNEGACLSPVTTPEDLMRMLG